MDETAIEPQRHRGHREDTESLPADLNDLTARVIGAAIEVHKHLGPGFLEATYAKALGLELELRQIPFVREAPVTLAYKGHPLGEGRLDFLVDDRLILELKAVDQLNPIHKAQTIAYLKATGKRLALLINFNTSLLKDHGIQRIAL